MTTGDLNGDNKPDIVTGDRTIISTGRASVLLNTTPVPVPLSIGGFELVDADYDKDVLPLTDGMTLKLSDVPRRLNVRADVFAREERRQRSHRH